MFLFKIFKSCPNLIHFDQYPVNKSNLIYQISMHEKHTCKCFKCTHANLYTVLTLWPVLLKEKLTLIHPYSRNKSVSTDLIYFSCFKTESTLGSKSKIETTVALNTSPNFIHCFVLAK